jgi:hypothetical protein
VCFEHTGYARQKAEQWWVRLTKVTDENPPVLSVLWGKNNSAWWQDYANDSYPPHIPKTVTQALECIESTKYYQQQDKNKEYFYLNEPIRIATRKNGKYTEVKEYEFNRTLRDQKSFDRSNQTA